MTSSGDVGTAALVVVTLVSMAFVFYNLVRALRLEFGKQPNNGEQIYTLINHERTEDDDWLLWIKPEEGEAFRVKGECTVWHNYPSGRRCSTGMERVFSDIAEGIVMQERERLLAKRDPVTIDMSQPQGLPSLDELWEAAERIGVSVEVSTGFGRKDYRGRVNVKIGASTVLCWGEGSSPRMALANAITEAFRRGARP